jgi:eukaryotic-like serine/threonine-protein kinase
MEDVTYLPRTCPRCGKALADDATEDLCAACLLAAATETLTNATLDDAMTVASGGAAVLHAAAPQLTEGQSWGPYRIGRLLGRGGMGEVHEAEHVDSGRRIALKVLRSQLHDADERARFLREGQLAASISHPHTVYIFGSEEIAGAPVISMELLPGGTLKDRVAAEGPLPPAVAVSAVLDIIGGLDAAQAAGILHRDIKPSNCFVDGDGSVKVGDFGLSISTLTRDVREQLATGFEGTPQFAAPEQLRGEPLDLRADIYAVGATLYYLLTGQPPFDARDLRELVGRVIGEPAQSPRALRPEIPSGLAAVILRCLSKSPGQRPASYPELAELLRPFSTIGESPASRRLRVLAFVVDIIIVTLPFSIADALTGNVVINGQNVSPAPNPWRWLLYAVYFFALEARWGASLGKQLFGLRLSSPGSHLRASRFGAQGVGWVKRVARRTMVFHVPWLVVSLLLVFFGPIGPTRDMRLGEKGSLNARQTRDLIESVLRLTLIAGLFVTARRSNGWAGLHDLAGGIRVVSRSSARLRSRRTVPASTPLDMAPSTRGPRYGPFIAMPDAVDSDRQMVVAFDPVLRRKVWIRLVAPHARPIDAIRRDLSRTGRLHWLTGRRSGTDNWDGFEAPDGQPLVAALREGTPQWSTLKSWLLDLSGELVAATRDGSMPVLRFDRLWVRDDDRLVLLDFPAPGTSGNYTAPTPTDAAPVQLLSAVAERSRHAASGSSVLMPLSAHLLLDSWSHQTPPSLSDAHAELVRVAAGLDRVKRARRALPMALAAIPLLGIISFITFVAMPTMNQFFGRDTTEMLGLLESLSAPTPPRGSRLVDPSVRQAMEIYVAGTHSERLRDRRFWNSPVMQQGIAKRLQPTAASVATRHPSVSPEELARATMTIAPELERLRTRQRGQNFSDLTPIVVTSVSAGLLLLILLLSVVSSLIVPGGLFTRMLGHAVVTRNGREIGRMLSLGRVLVASAPAIAWLLYLASSPKVQGFVPTPPNPLLGTMLTLAALGVGVIFTIARPERGPHDWLLGTWVVPR